MAIAYRSGSTAGNAVGAALTITKPAGVVDGDILIAVLYREVSGIWTLPTGWTSIVDQISGASNAWITLVWKRAAGEPANYTFTPAASTWRVITMSAFSGALAAGTPYEAATGSSTPPDIITAPSITTTVANTMLVFGTGNFAGNDVGVGTSGMTQGDQLGGNEIFYVIQAAAGASGTKQFTVTAMGLGDWTGGMLALKPATGGTSVSVSASIGSALATGPSANITANVSVSANVGSAGVAGASASTVAGSGVSVSATVGTPQAAGASATFSANVAASTNPGAAASAGPSAKASIDIATSTNPGTAASTGPSATFSASVTASANPGAAQAAGANAAVSIAAGSVSVTVTANPGSAHGASPTAQVSANVAVSTSIGSVQTAAPSAQVGFGITVSTRAGLAEAAGVSAGASANVSLSANAGADQAAGVSITLSLATLVIPADDEGSAVITRSWLAACSISQTAADQVEITQADSQAAGITQQQLGTAAVQLMESQEVKK